MGSKAKSRCRSGMLKVNKWRHSYLNAMKLENYGPVGECLKNNHQTSEKLYFSFFAHTKMADCILKSSLKT
jgi:hypothetical protein